MLELEILVQLWVTRHYTSSWNQGSDPGDFEDGTTPILQLLPPFELGMEGEMEMGRIPIPYSIPKTDYPLYMYPMPGSGWTSEEESRSRERESESERDGNVGSGEATMWSVQREPTSVTLSPSMTSTSSLTADGTTTSTPLFFSPSPGFGFWVAEVLNVDIVVFGSRVASSIDAVLLSHSDTLHLGALPYAMKRLGLSAPIYSTEPVYRLGLLSMYDQYLSRKQVSEFDLFTLDDIDSAFQNVNRLTYSQNHHLSGKGEGIVIAPHVAGHLLGGTVWKITKDGEDVIYAVDFNHRKERHLNGTVLESFVRPAVLITDAYNALNNQPSRRQRDQEFLDAILKTLRADGNVLLPVDTTGRVLELILILEQYWAQHHLTYPIFFLTYVASSTIDYVKSFLEWMSDSIAKSFEHTRDNAFLLKHVTLLINKSELETVPDGPKIVLASMASLEAGFSHDIFVEWAPDTKNLMLFTERGQFGTLARMLQADPPPKAVKVTMSKREEALKASIIKEEETSHGSDPTVADPMVVDASNVHASSDVAVQHSGTFRDIFIDGFVPPSSSFAPMFPFYENNPEWDDFGEIINPDDYVIKEEDMYQGSLQVGGDLNGKLDEASASLILDMAPSKVVSNELTVQVKCSLVYMDFEGRSDGRSLKSILAHVAPLKLVQLSEKLMSNVLFKKLGDYEVAWVDAEVGKTEGGMLSLLPLSTPAPPHKSVFVGDIKMADFKQFLASKGVPVEFSGGALRCGEYTTLRKVGDASQMGGAAGIQQIIIEGPLSEEYYKIRDYLYSQFYSL
ncbi:cleavage and polyadenylation specificity factor 100 [Actinidia rufa]|uniref:Cleavage and polyadenylation specificity factor subunit 2 n=1 Tax=Actinidia rufa TaxID=165716 RepID=A0A7J0GWX7_9ERIC|nr:cleavage and polyadenylation specificity factor 100 [Actinidia rufa]